MDDYKTLGMRIRQFRIWLVITIVPILFLASCSMDNPVPDPMDNPVPDPMDNPADDLIAQILNPQIAVFQAADTQEERGFGYDVDISGNAVIAGTADTGDPGRESVYVFEWDGTEWLQAYNREVSPSEATAFGESVAISGNTAAFGQGGYEDSGHTPGFAHILDRDSTGTWTATAGSISGTSGTDQRFGWDVAVDGSTVLVGSGYDIDIDLKGEGESDYYYLVQVLDSADASINYYVPYPEIETSINHFGVALAISGNTIAVGNVAATNQAARFIINILGLPGADEKGSVYVYTSNSAGSWADSTPAHISPNDLKIGDDFGTAIAADGAALVVGAPGDSADRGAVYVFGKSGGTWSAAPTAVLRAAGGADGDRFGHSVDVSGRVVIVGAPQADSAAGAVYVFYLKNGTWTESKRIARNENGQADRAANNLFGNSVAIDGAAVIIGEPGYSNRNGRVHILNNN
ncbi:MAG: FG-GAP repeat protein [Salinispira sp.]